jgi:hypothetical protein
MLYFGKRPEGSKPAAAKSATPEKNGTLQYMEEHHIPMTRENYIQREYGGTPPEEFGPELETQPPEQFRKKAFVKPTNI